MLADHFIEVVKQVDITDPSVLPVWAVFAYLVIKQIIDLTLSLTNKEDPAKAKGAREQAEMLDLLKVLATSSGRQNDLLLKMSATMDRIKDDMRQLADEYHTDRKLDSLGRRLIGSQHSQQQAAGQGKLVDD